MTTGGDARLSSLAGRFEGGSQTRWPLGPHHWRRV